MLNIVVHSSQDWDFILFLKTAIAGVICIFSKGIPKKYQAFNANTFVFPGSTGAIGAGLTIADRKIFFI